MNVQSINFVCILTFVQVVTVKTRFKQTGIDFLHKYLLNKLKTQFVSLKMNLYNITGKYIFKISKSRHKVPAYFVSL